MVAVLEHSGRPRTLRGSPVDCVYPLIQPFPFAPLVLRRLSVTLGGFVPPGVNQLPNKQLLDQRRPGVSGVAAVGGGAVGLQHRAAPERVDLGREAHAASEPFMASRRSLKTSLHLHQQVEGGSRLLTQHPEPHTLCGGHDTR